MSTLYERVGGQAAIVAAVDGLYDRILLDPELEPFFHGVDMATQSRKMISLLAHAFGGPEALQGRNLRDAHRGLVARGLTHQHFDAVVGHLQRTLENLGIAAEIREEVGATIEATRADVLGLDTR